MEKKIDLCGSELVALAGSVAVALSKKLGNDDLRKLRFLLNAISSNLLIIEAEGRTRTDKKDC